MRPTCTQTGECDGHDCWAHLEWFCPHAGLARCFSGEDKLGDPYCYCLPFVVRKRFWFPRLRAWWTGKPMQRGWVEYVGVHPVMRPCQYRTLRAIREEGYGILSTRVKDGQKRTIEICKKRP